MSRLKARLDRLEAALIPATPQILTITAIASTTGEIIHERRRAEGRRRDVKGR
jgi:hypothetical protein